MKKERPSRRHG